MRRCDRAAFDQIGEHLFGTMTRHNGAPACVSTRGMADPGKGTDVTERICSIEGCDRPSRKRGWCLAHYERWRDHGDPNHRPRLTVEERLLRRRIITPAGCWEWQGALRKGYGTITVVEDGKRRARGVHQVSWELANGPVPDGLQLDHVVCDNRRCFNPEHLAPVTSQANTLRSPLNPAAINARKTHCSKCGHPLEVISAGRRGCLPCRRASQRAWKRARRRTAA